MILCFLLGQTRNDSSLSTVEKEANDLVTHDLIQPGGLAFPSRTFTPRR